MDHFESHWSRRASVHFCTAACYSTPLLLCLCPIVADWTLDNTVHSPVAPAAFGPLVGGWVGRYPWMFTEEGGLGKGWGLIVTGQIPGGEFLASFCGRISNQRPLTAPLQPNPGNPINCVRQRELVSIDPHSAGLWLAHKGHSHVETNAGAEKPRGGPDSAALAPLPQMWSCVSSPLIKQETPIEKVCLPNQTLHSPLPVQTGTAFIFYQVFMLTPWRAALIDWLKMQGLLTRGNKTPSLWST